MRDEIAGGWEGGSRGGQEGEVPEEKVQLGGGEGREGGRQRWGERVRMEGDGREEDRETGGGGGEGGKVG